MNSAISRRPAAGTTARRQPLDTSPNDNNNKQTLGGMSGGARPRRNSSAASVAAAAAATASNKRHHLLLLLAAALAGALCLVALLAADCLASPMSGSATSGPTTIGLSSGGSVTASGRSESKGIFKRSFAGLGCLGVYDKAKFARLDRVCEECYTLYREPDIHTACRQDCFRNNVFTRCVDALLLSHEAKKFDEMVDELYGK